MEYKSGNIAEPDMAVGAIEGQDIIKPNFQKVFLFAGTDSKITQHKCLYEGKAAFEKLKDHVIVAQITIFDDGHHGSTYDNIEHTPVARQINSLEINDPLPNDTKIWRYLTMSKFLDLIDSASLYFARIDRFTDNLEGTAPLSNIKNILADTEKNDTQKREGFRLFKTRMENNRKVSFACCWHINTKINHTMWDEYGANSIESICIQSNLKRINNVLAISGLPFLNKPVQYFDEPYFNQNVYWFPTLFKRRKYDYEQEYRCLLFAFGLEKTGFKLKIDINQLINKIHIHPKASKDFFKTIQLLIKAKGLNVSITKERY